jgi:parallel beta-helix repeat protein
VQFDVVRAGTIISGPITTDTVWDLAGSPYWIEDNVTIERGVNLTIMPSVEVLFKGDYVLWVFGDLYTVGGEGNRVIFTLNNPSPGPSEKFKMSVMEGGNITMEHSFVGYGSLVLHNCVDTRIRFSEFSSSRTSAIDIEPCDDVLIEGVDIHDCYSYAIDINDSSSNVTIKSSRFVDNPHGIVAFGPQHNFLIANNTFENQSQYAILVLGTGHTITGNEVSNSIAGIDAGGDPFLRGADITIAANLVHHNMVGIGSSYAANVTIHNNSIWNNSWRGISMWDVETSRVQDNVISDNPTEASVGAGILAGAVRTTRFMRNRFEDNNVSMIVESTSSGNLVFHNSFVNNTVQARDDGSGNGWDDGYPSGGNYWSDYVGVDMCSGPLQDNCPDPDGIGDTPYPVDNNTLDRYPFTSPYVGVPPQPPEMIDAFLSGMNLQNTTITWSISPDDDAGNESVVAYAIYRGPAYNPERLSYDLIVTLPSGSSTHTDGLVGEGDPGNYFYSVCAVDVFGNAACSSNQAGKVTRPLASGPTLASTPLIQSDRSTECVLQTVEYDKAWYYDHSSQEWQWYMKDKNYRRGLLSIDHTMGLWVNVTASSNLTVAGIVPAQTTIRLHEGWNLVSFPSVATSFTVGDMKVSLPIERVEGFGTAPPYLLRILSDSDVFLTGRAYWVKVQVDVDWLVAFE